MVDIIVFIRRVFLEQIAFLPDPTGSRFLPKYPVDRYILFYLYTLTKCDNIFLFLLFGSLRPTREFFTYMETSPLPVKGCKFLPMYPALVIIEW